MPSQNCLLFHVGPSCSYFSFVILLNLLSSPKLGDARRSCWLPVSCSCVLPSIKELFQSQRKSHVALPRGCYSHSIFCQWNVRAESAAPQHLICLAVFDHGCNSTAFLLSLKGSAKSVQFFMIWQRDLFKWRAENIWYGRANISTFLSYCRITRSG